MSTALVSARNVGQLLWRTSLSVAVGCLAAVLAAATYVVLGVWLVEHGWSEHGVRVAAGLGIIAWIALGILASLRVWSSLLEREHRWMLYRRYLLALGLGICASLVGKVAGPLGGAGRFLSLMLGVAAMVALLLAVGVVLKYGGAKQQGPHA